MNKSAVDEEVTILKARVRDLEAVLKQNDPSLMMAFRLTPAASDLFGLLLSVPYVTTEMIRQRLEIATDGKVAVHRLRQQLKPWNIVIQSRRSLGYWLDPATKEQVRSVLNGGVFALPQPEPEVTYEGIRDEKVSEAA